MEAETAYHSAAGDNAQYYIDSGATGHYIEEISALHDYIPFEVPRIIRTAANHQVQALGSGTLKFTATVYGRETQGELENVYYIPGIRSCLISIGKLFSQGWEPHLSHNGFALHDRKGTLVIRAPMKGNTYTATLRTMYPNLGLCARESEGEETTDEQLYERLKLKSPPVAFTTGEGGKTVSLYNWHQRMGHRSVRTIVDIAKGAVTEIILEDSPNDIPKLDNCPSCALMKAQRTRFKDGWTHATEPLQLIHGDLVEIGIPFVGHAPIITLVTGLCPVMISDCRRRGDTSCLMVSFPMHRYAMESDDYFYFDPNVFKHCVRSTFAFTKCHFPGKR